MTQTGNYSITIIEKLACYVKNVKAGISREAKEDILGNLEKASAFISLGIATAHIPTKRTYILKGKDYINKAGELIKEAKSRKAVVLYEEAIKKIELL